MARRSKAVPAGPPAVARSGRKETWDRVATAAPVRPPETQAAAAAATTAVAGAALETSQAPAVGAGRSFVEAGAQEPSFELNTAEATAGITITYAGGTETVPFSESGSEQSFVVPIGVSHIKVVASGADGEDGCGCFRAGLGLKVTATLPVEHGQKYFIDFVGGGSGYPAGGNAADLRTVSRSEAGSLASRILVAAGGGASGITEENSFGGGGGNAGFTEGGAGGTGDANTGGGGGTQAHGGAAGKGEVNGTEGQLGQGGSGGANSEGFGGGGGGGYYGGGGGAGGSGADGGGGGGSSYVASAFEEVSSALDGSKEQASLVIIYQSAAPPTASITTPAEGAVYTEGQTVDASYTCTEGTGGPGLKPGSEGCSGTVAKGGAVETSTPGEHHFTVTATSNDGLSKAQTVSYTVGAPPTASITTPAEGAVYTEGQTVDASYTCTEGTGGPGLKPGSEGCSGTVAKGGAVETSTPGRTPLHRHRHEQGRTQHGPDRDLHRGGAVVYDRKGTGNRRQQRWLHKSQETVRRRW